MQGFEPIMTEQELEQQRAANWRIDGNAVHTVEEARFTTPPSDTEHMADSWAVHQAAATVDFAQDDRLVSWLVGGLNFQIEHHLFPTLSHVNYPAIAGVVEATCREFGVPYTANPSLGAAMASHFRWLKRMGQGEGAG